MTETQLSARQKLDAIVASKKRPVAVAPVATQPVAEQKSAATDETTAARDLEIKANIKNNPIYGMMHNPALTKEERLSQLATFFDNNAGVKTAENMKAARDYQYFIQMVRRELAVGQIRATADKIHSEYQQTIDSLYHDLGDFQSTVAPLREVFELIQKYNKEEQEGTSEPLADRIFKALGLHKLQQTQQQENLRAADRLEAEVKYEEENTLRDLQNEYDASAAGMMAFTRKAETANLAVQLKVAREEITNKRKQIVELRQAPAQEDESKEYDPNLLRILDVSGAEFQKQATTAADRTISLINSAQERMDESIMGLIGVQDRVAELFKYANDIDLYVSTLQIAAQRALQKNKIDPSKEAQVPGGDVERLENIEREVEVSSRQRYLSELTSFERSLNKTSMDVKKGVTSISVLDENIRQSIEQAAEVRSNTIATVSESVSTFLQAIVFESNANKIDMISGVLDRVRITAENAQQGQIEMLPQWMRKDNAAMQRRIETVTGLNNLLDETRQELIGEKELSVQLSNILGEAVSELQQTTRETREVMTNPIFAETGSELAARGARPTVPAPKAPDTPSPFPGM